ncbi:MAG: ABC transporter ATP-binding protein [Candidatus Kariarchaeaceae archaeon]
MSTTNVDRYPGYKKWFFKHSVRYKTLTSVYISCLIICAAVSSYIPVVIGRIIDEVISSQSKSQINSSVLLLLSLSLVTFLVFACFNILASLWAFKNEKNIRNELFDSIQSKSVEFHNTTSSGDMMSLTTNDVNAISGFYIQTTNLITNSSTMIFIFLLLIFKLDIILAVFLIPFIPVFLIVFKDFRNKTAPIADDHMRKFSSMATTLQDSISGAEVVRSFVAEDMEREKFRNSVNGFRDNWISQNKLEAQYFPMLVVSFAIGANMIIGSYLVFHNYISIGVLVTANLLLLRVKNSMGNLYWDIYSLERALAAASRIAKIVDQEDEDQKEEYRSFPDEITGEIEFRNVSFYHMNGSKKLILNNINFTIKPNQKVALVGPTGCGKTTIAKLLLRFYDPQEGEILIDGVNIKEYNLEELRQNIGYIEQDIYLFPRSISENIKFGNPEASEEEILDAAELAQVDEFVQDLKEKYETIAGDRGVRFSGGQRQRIAISRAILTNPRVLIMDDASSAIDSETEEKIVKAMNSVLENRSTLIITHRLHAIRDSDKVLVLKNGKIKAEGSHDELMSSSEDYRRIFGKHIPLPEIIIQ